MLVCHNNLHYSDAAEPENNENIQLDVTSFGMLSSKQLRYPAFCVWEVILMGIRTKFTWFQITSYCFEQSTFYLSTM